jgi:hypothetical protein
MVTTIVGGSIGGILVVLLALPDAASIKAVTTDYLMPTDDAEPVEEAPEPPPG